MNPKKCRIARLEDENHSLRTRLHLLEEILESSVDLLAAQDTDYRYIAFNSAYQRETKRVFGIDIDIGTSMAEALAALPADREKAMALWGRAFAGEVFTVIEKFQGIGEERFFEGQWHPLRDARKKIIGAAHIVREVTDRVRMEHALRDSEEVFRASFDNASVGMVQLDLGGRISRVNRRFCEIVGYGRDELLKSSPLEITAPEHRKRDRRKLKALLNGEIAHYHAEKCFLRKDGARIWAYLAASLVRDAAGEPLRTLAVIEDISARKRMESELLKAKKEAEEANHAKSEFLATMSHEIRTPMTVFTAAVEQLRSLNQDAALNTYLELAESSVKRLHTLIEDILDFSRIEARQVVLAREPFDPRACVENVLGMLGGMAREKGLTLRLEAAPEVPRIVIGDPDRVAQVLLNLVNNGIKFTERGGVEVSLRLRSERLIFAVADSGRGIPEEKRERLFHRFSQLDSFRSRRQGGTGLGLAICKGLVGLMNGKIGMEGRTGGGSIFTVELPLHLPDIQGAAEPVEERVQAAGLFLAGARILVAEDDPAIGKVLRLLLEQRGLHVQLACSGVEAVDRWREADFDLILMDLQLPEVSGEEATERIRDLESATSPRIPIIGLSAHARLSSREACLAAGMDDFITKPVLPEILYDILSRHLGH